MKKQRNIDVSSLVGKGGYDIGVVLALERGGYAIGVNFETGGYDIRVVLASGKGGYALVVNFERGGYDMAFDFAKDGYDIVPRLGEKWIRCS